MLQDFGDSGSGSQSYSVYAVAWRIQSQATDDIWSQIGINYMIYLFLFCTAVVPMAQMITLAMMWNMQLTLRQQKRLFLANETLGAWQHAHPFLIVALRRNAFRK